MSELLTRLWQRHLVPDLMHSRSAAAHPRYQLNFRAIAALTLLRADPRDPNRLDADRDGIACESNRHPRRVARVPR